jgi:hypothetical protein
MAHIGTEICFNEAIVFLKISTSSHTGLAAETYLVDGEFLKVAVNGEEFLKLRGKSRTPEISKTDGQHFKPE